MAKPPMRRPGHGRPTVVTPPLAKRIELLGRLSRQYNRAREFAYDAMTAARNGYPKRARWNLRWGLHIIRREIQKEAENAA